MVRDVFGGMGIYDGCVKVTSEGDIFDEVLGAKIFHA